MKSNQTGYNLLSQELKNLKAQILVSKSNLEKTVSIGSIVISECPCPCPPIVSEVLYVTFSPIF